MSDGIQSPDWQDSAPEHQDSSLRHLDESDTWLPDGQQVTDSALKIDGPKQALKSWDAGSKVVDSFGSVESLTDWGGLYDAGSTLVTQSFEIADQVGKFVTAAQKIMGDPLGWLSGTIVDFLLGIFTPLDDLLQLVSGNEGLMKNSAEMWGAAADGCPQISEYIVESGHSAIEAWQGDAGDAARMRIYEVGIGLQVMGYGAVAMKHIMTYIAELAKAAYDKVKQYLAEGVEWALTRVAAYIASSVATLGAAVPVAIADTVRKVATLIIDAYKWIKRAIEIFTNAVKSCQKLQEIVQKVMPVLTKLKAISDGYQQNKPGIEAAIDLGGQAFK